MVIPLPFILLIVIRRKFFNFNFRKNSRNFQLLANGFGAIPAVSRGQRFLSPWARGKFFLFPLKGGKKCPLCVPFRLDVIEKEPFLGGIVLALHR
jgi:hypothetical protein